MRKNYRPKILIPAAALSLLFALFSFRPVDYSQVQIRRVVDGDTIELAGGKFARYIGIDTPELERKTPSGWRKVNEPLAHEAKRFNEELVLKNTSRFEFDVVREDKYHRLLVYCFVKKDKEEVLVQAELLKAGLAYLYTFPPNVKYADSLAAALKEARDKRRGIWSVMLDIEAKDAARFIGQRKMVVGKIKRARSTAKTIRLAMTGLLLVVFKNDLAFFEREGIDPAKTYNGKKVRVYGLVKEYQGEPEIIVSGPWQIEII